MHVYLMAYSVCRIRIWIRVGFSETVHSVRESESLFVRIQRIQFRRGFAGETGSGEQRNDVTPTSPAYTNNDDVTLDHVDESTDRSICR